MASASWQYASLPVERLAIMSGADPLGLFFGLEGVG